jgi:phosphatidylethanolamine/phosphatidyl-N-methylethanolamine N-methyltransferase
MLLRFYRKLLNPTSKKGNVIQLFQRRVPIMSTQTTATKKSFMSKESETGFFLRRVLSNPRQLGAVMPSSPYLGRLIAAQVNISGTAPILELGGGTGSLTQSLITAGVNPDRLYVIELDEELCNFLKRKFPNVHIIHGNAADLQSVLPTSIFGSIESTVSGLPLLNMPMSVRTAIIKGVFAAMGDGGHLIQYTYSPKSSIDSQLYGLKENKVGSTLRNIPPATIWKYTI